MYAPEEVTQFYQSNVADWRSILTINMTHGWKTVLR